MNAMMSGAGDNDMTIQVHDGREAASASAPSIVRLPCSVCKAEPATLANRHLLGTDDALCHACFLLWYDEGITSREEILRRRQAV